ncbi:hypothetical protein CRG98_008528, partial [Punica granatum]
SYNEKSKGEGGQDRQSVTCTPPPRVPDAGALGGRVGVTNPRVGFPGRFKVGAANRRPRTLH